MVFSSVKNTTVKGHKETALKGLAFSSNIHFLFSFARMMMMTTKALMKTRKRKMRPTMNHQQRSLRKQNTTVMAMSHLHPIMMKHITMSYFLPRHFQAAQII